MPPQLDRAEFRAWLAAMPGDAVAGETSEPESCPLAMHLITQGASRPAVAESYYVLNATAEHLWGPRRHLLPWWTRKFIAAVDRTRGGGSAITAAECIQILDAIPEAQ